MGHNLWRSRFGVDEHPFATYDVHRRYRVLTHSHFNAFAHRFLGALVPQSSKGLNASKLRMRCSRRPRPLQPPPQWHICAWPGPLASLLSPSSKVLETQKMPRDPPRVNESSNAVPGFNETKIQVCLWVAVHKYPKNVLASRCAKALLSQKALSRLPHHGRVLCARARSGVSQSGVWSQHGGAQLPIVRKEVAAGRKLPSACLKMVTLSMFQFRPCVRNRLRLVAQQTGGSAVLLLCQPPECALEYEDLGLPKRIVHERQWTSCTLFWPQLRYL